MKKTYLLIMLLLTLLATNFVYAYPPENAALIYYRLMDRFEKPDKAIWDQLCKLPISTEPASEEVKAFIESQKKNFIIPELEIASELKYCDWGEDISQGIAMQTPPLHYMKSFAYLLLVDGAIAANQGDISTALDKNLVVRRMAHHCPNKYILGYLVTLPMTTMSNDALKHILATHVIDETTLIEFKRELLLDSYRLLSFREALIGERNLAVFEIPTMTAERFNEFFFEPSEEDKKRASEMFKDPGFADRSIKYIEQYYDKVLPLLDKPYTQAFSGWEKETQKIVEDSNNGNDEAFLFNDFISPIARCYRFSYRWETEYNAMLNALDVYIAFQKTGKLPDTLPQDSYPDCFSDKPFIYEVTKDGFILRCQQEELVDKKVYEYTFKLPK